MLYCPNCKRETHVHHRPKTGEYWRECNNCNWRSEPMTREEAYEESPKVPIIRDKEEDK